MNEIKNGLLLDPLGDKSFSLNNFDNNQNSVIRNRREHYLPQSKIHKDYLKKQQRGDSLIDSIFATTNKVFFKSIPMIELLKATDTEHLSLKSDKPLKGLDENKTKAKDSSSLQCTHQNFKVERIHNKLSINKSSEVIDIDQSEKEPNKDLTVHSNVTSTDKKVKFILTREQKHSSSNKILYEGKPN